MVLIHSYTLPLYPVIPSFLHSLEVPPVGIIPDKKGTSPRVQGYRRRRPRQGLVRSGGGSKEDKTLFRCEKGREVEVNLRPFLRHES